MGVFILTTDFKDSAKQCREYAEERSHWYEPGPGVTPPGHRSRHVLESGTIRSVFSWTKEGDRLYRHLSVTTTGEGRYPAPIVIWTLAHLLGFTGVMEQEDGFVHKPGEDWQFALHQLEDSVVVAQEIFGETVVKDPN